MASSTGVKGEESLIGVLAYYDLGAFRACRRIEHGYVNETWDVETTGGRYVLKRRHPSLRETGAIAGQHALVCHLSAVGFPAPSLVTATSGATFVQLGQEVYEVQKYIAGSLCDARSPCQSAIAARTLGWYHHAVSGFDHSALHRECERYGLGALERVMSSVMKGWEGRVNPQVARLWAALAQHASDLQSICHSFGDLHELVIHGDYYAGNLLWRSGTIVGVVDYDQAHWCARVLELAEALIYFARESNVRFRHIVYPGVLDLDRVERFLEAYTEIVNLSDAEIRALPHWIRIIWMCASLDPPLRPRMSLEEAAQALPEVLALADWASVHASDIIEAAINVHSGQIAL